MESAATERLILEQVFDNALVGICFMQDRRFVRVNRRMEEILGYGPGTLIGLSVRAVYARREDFEEVEAVLSAFPASNRYVHERPLTTRNGDIRWCQISGRLIDPRDSRSASVWVIQDLTDKKNAEDQLERQKQKLEETVRRRTLNLQKTNAALRLEVERRRETERAMIESREKYRVLFRNIPLAFVITDADGLPIEINPAMQAHLGVRDAEQVMAAAQGMSCMLNRDGSKHSLLQLIRQLCPVDTRRVEHASIQWRTADGVDRHFDLVGVRVPVRGLGSAVVFADRTDARRAREREQEQQQQLAHATRLSLMGQFASALAHELGQPLNACISYAAGIEHRLGPQLDARPDAREGLHYIRLHLDQAANVIRNVRAFIAKHRPGDEPVELEPLLRDTLDLLRWQVRKAGAQIELEVEPGLPPARGSRIELQQVIVNLLVNALEAPRAAGEALRIEVRVAKRRESEITVSVLDNGEGVPPELRERIFQPYVTTKPTGLGMGLMMCRTIAESHGGSLKLDGRRRHGACFVLTLPLT